MAPRACSLYDWVKLYKLKKGRWPYVEELPGKGLLELKAKGWARVVNISREGSYAEFLQVQLIK